MRILHAIHSTNPAGGGPVEGIKQLALALSKFDYKIEVLCLDGPDDPWIAEFPLPIHTMGPSFLKYGWSSKLIPWLRANHSNYDVIIVNGLWQFQSYAVWYALRNTETPYCVFPHGMLDPWFRHHYPVKHLKKWLYWVWGDYRVLRDAAAVFFTTDEERLLAPQSFSLYSCRPVVVNYGTIGPAGDPVYQKALFLERYPELRDKRVILFLGRVHEKKGCDLLMDAFHQLITENADTSIRIVMAGPYDCAFGQSVQQMAQDHGIAECVTWCGMLSGDLKWGAFHAADAFILPSHQENFGIAVAEALACSLPVLISNKVNIWREIQADGAGIIESDDFAGTLRLLKSWESMSPEDRDAMRHNARMCFETRFEISIAAANLNRALQKVATLGAIDVPTAP